MGRVEDNVAKAFPMLADVKLQDLAVSMFCQGLRDQDGARMTVIQAKGELASVLRIGTLATAFGKKQQYAQRYEPSRRRYPANDAVHDDQGDAEEEGHEGDAEWEYEQDDEGFYAGAQRNFRGR